jgi:hypothetical protein
MLDLPHSSAVSSSKVQRSAEFQTSIEPVLFTEGGWS